QDIGSNVRNRRGVELHNMGDLDGDGDDEVLAAVEYLFDDQLLRILDAEPGPGGLTQIFDDQFDLPLPQGIGRGDILSFQALVGDYDGDGRRDVAVALTWEDPEIDSSLFGTLALWLDPALRDGNGPVLEPEEPQSPAPSQASRACGCSTQGPASGGLLLL